MQCDVLTRCAQLYMLREKVFCSHTPSIAWELKKLSEQEKKLSESLLIVATSVPVLMISTVNVLLFRPS